jgi:hypothetical protein
LEKNNFFVDVYVHLAVGGLQIFDLLGTQKPISAPGK